MKKVLLVLFITGSIFTYSSVKCEKIAAKGTERLLQEMKNKGIEKVSYRYLGENKGKQNLYLYELAIVMERIENKVLLGVDVTNGGFYLAADYTLDGLSKGQGIDFQLLETGEESLKCKEY